MDRAVECDVADYKLEVIQRSVEEDAIRRTADVVVIVPISVVESVAEVVLTSPIPMCVVVRRECVDMVAVVVRAMVVEA